MILKVCTPKIEIWGDELTAEIRETVDGGYPITEAMIDGTVTFTYNGFAAIGAVELLFNELGAKVEIGKGVKAALQSIK